MKPAPPVTRMTRSHEEDRAVADVMAATTPLWAGDGGGDDRCGTSAADSVAEAAVNCASLALVVAEFTFGSR